MNDDFIIDDYCLISGINKIICSAGEIIMQEIIGTQQSTDPLPEDKNNDNTSGKTKKVGNYLIYLNRILGEGSFGRVFEAKSLITGEMFAIKAISRHKYQDESQLMALLNQIEIMTSINSPFVVKCVDSMVTSRSFYLVLELCKMSLRDLMNNKKTPGSPEKDGIFEEKEAIKFMKGLLQGFFQLYIKGIVHRDLKPDNILVNKGSCKLSDFGTSLKCRRNNKQLYKKVGTRCYQAPEVYNGDKYNEKCDVWAFGLILYELLYGELPTALSGCETNLQKKLENIQQVIPPSVRSNRNPQVSLECISLLKSCLQYHEEDRADWIQIFSSPIFQTGLNMQLNRLEMKRKYIINSIRTQIIWNQSNIVAFFAKYEDQIRSNTFELGKTQFFSLISKIIPTVKINKEEIQYTFDYLDINSDGKISKDQFIQQIQKEDRNQDQSEQKRRKQMLLKENGMRKLVTFLVKEKMEKLQGMMERSSQKLMTKSESSQIDKILNIGRFMCPQLKDKETLAIFKEFKQKTENEPTPKEFQEYLIKMIAK